MYNAELLTQWRKDIDKRNQAIGVIVEMQSTVRVMGKAVTSDLSIKKVVDACIVSVKDIMPSVDVNWKGEDEPQKSELEELAAAESEG